MAIVKFLAKQNAARIATAADPAQLRARTYANERRRAPGSDKTEPVSGSFP
jgi:hypothetical protein